MRSAIIGLPQSGKTTLTAAVTGVQSDGGNPNQPRHAVVRVPDHRLPFLAKLYNPKKVTETTIEYIDVPGFSLADQKGREDLKRYLPEIRQVELLVLVIRAFENPAVPAYRDRVKPAADLAELREELVYADLVTITARIEKVEKSLKKPTMTHDQEKHELDVLRSCVDALEASKPISAVLSNPEDLRIVGGFALLTQKPQLVVYNVSDSSAADPDPPPPEYTAGAINLCAATELEIAQLDPADRPAFLEDLGVAQPARERLIQKCYETLGLISFLTVGPKEVRAWALERGSDAVDAAAKIHTDMARGFIRAETVAFDQLTQAGDMKAAKAEGWVRQEGKSYIVQDGDVIFFKFNV